MAIRDELLTAYDHEMATTRRLLERIPDGKLSWKPHPKSMSLGGLATHLGNLPNWGVSILKEAFYDLAAAPPNMTELGSRAAILEFFDTSTRSTRALMDMTDGEYQSLWALRRGGHELFCVPRASAFRTFVLHHIVHHRGQLSVYLRLNDIPVPPIYGPTADEGQ